MFELFYFGGTGLLGESHLWWLRVLIVIGIFLSLLKLIIRVAVAEGIKDANEERKADEKTENELEPYV